MAETLDGFDYVVVGGGFAGCVVAARLSEDPRVRVLLLEAGGENDHEESYYATGIHGLWQTPADWNFESAPQPHLGGRRIRHPRGRLIGGSAAINVGSWSRGIAADYDRWVSAGADGWGWNTAREAFVAMESSARPEVGGRGQHGPMMLEDTPAVSNMTDAFRRACVETGLGETVDHNGQQFEGFDRWETIFVHGRRRNTAEAYLAPARIRPNLKVMTHAFVTRLQMEGRRATGVVFERDGVEHWVKATAEVLLCAGAFLSPQILMVSGIGPADHLRSHGIEPVIDSPSVGSNLIDHVGTKLGWAAARPGGIAPVYPDAHVAEQLETWRRTGQGRLAANENPCIAFTRSGASAALADVELLFHVNPPASLRTDDKTGGFFMVVANVDPISRGHVRLESKDPHTLPMVDPAYLSDERDLRVLVGGVHKVMALAHSSPLAPYTARSELSVEAADDEIVDWIRTHPVSMYHPVGTARMGRADDPQAVLDSELRVRGS